MRSRSLSHGIIFDSPIQPSNLKSNPLNLQYTRWALQSLQVKLLEPQNNWVCMGSLIHPTYRKKTYHHIYSWIRDPPCKPLYT